MLIGKDPAKRAGDRGEVQVQDVLCVEFLPTNGEPPVPALPPIGEAGGGVREQGFAWREMAVVDKWNEKGWEGWKR